MRDFKNISKPSKDEQKVAMESYAALATVIEFEADKKNAKSKLGFSRCFSYKLCWFD